MVKDSITRNNTSETEISTISFTVDQAVRKTTDKSNAGKDGYVSSGPLPAYLKGEKYSSRRGVLVQCFAAGAVLMLSAAVGAPIGYSATTLPQLRIENGSMRADDEMGSWIASIHSIATPIGSAFCGKLMEAFGRRRALIITVLPLVMGWVVIATSQHLAQMLVGRFICGISVGLSGATSHVYLGEISEPKLRGLLIGTPICAYSLGIFYINFLGGLLGWRYVALASIVIPIVALIALIFSPESPTWLARKEKFTLAAKSMAKLRGDSELSKRELNDIISKHDAEKLGGETKPQFSTLITKPAALKPLFIILSLIIAQKLSGTFLVIFYAVDLMEDFRSAIDPKVATIIASIVRTIVTVISCILLLKIARRPLFLCAGVSQSLVAIVLVISVYFFKSYPLLIVILYILYIAANSLGFMLLPILTISELLPVQVRGICGGYICSLMHVLMFGMTKLYPIMKNAMGIEGLFLMFACSSIFGTVIIYLLLPETKNRTLIDIERYFQQSNVLWITRKKNNTSSVHNKRPVTHEAYRMRCSI